MPLNNHRGEVNVPSIVTGRDNWISGKIGDFASVKHGYAFKGSQFTDVDTRRVVLTPRNFNIGGGFRSEKLKFTIQDCPEEYILHGGDIIVSMTDLSKDGDTLGYSAKVPSNRKYKYLHNQRIGLIKFKESKVLPDYIYWVMRTREFNSFLVGSATGSTVKHTSPSIIEEFPFCYPPNRNEQRLISDTLSNLDSKIELNQEMNKTLESIAHALFKHWFIDFEFPDENGNPYKSSGGEMVESELGEIPKGWKISKIGNELSTVLGGTPSTNKKEYWSNGNFGWINSGKVNEFRIIEPSSYITETALNNSATKLMPKGTTVLAITGATLGRVSMIESEMCANQSVIGVLSNEKISSEYIYFWIKFYINKLISGQTGGAQQHINKENVNSLELLVPKNSLEKFNKTCGPIFNQISNNCFESLTLSKVRDVLLPKLMSGKIRVTLEEINDKKNE